MKILKILLYLVLALVALLLLAGLFAKKEYHIERSIDIKAPKSLILEQVSCFRNFPKWSPWQDLDLTMKFSSSETDCQVGSWFSWAGNDKVGEGKITTKAITPDRLDMEVVFLKPWEATNPSFFKLEEKPDGVVKTTWGFDMKMPFPMNGLAMFTDVDKGVGADYEKGLARLKTLCETLAAKKKYRGYEVAETDLPLLNYLGIRKSVKIADVAKVFEADIPAAMTKNSIAPESLAGAPACIFWVFDEKAGKSEMSAAVPVAADFKPAAGYSIFPLGGKKAYVIDYYGSYEGSGEAHMAMDAFMEENGLQFVAPVIEQYITDAGMEKDTAKWLTKVVYFAEPKPAEPAAAEKK